MTKNEKEAAVKALVLEAAMEAACPVCDELVKAGGERLCPTCQREVEELKQERLV